MRKTTTCFHCGKPFKEGDRIMCDEETGERFCSISCVVAKSKKEEPGWVDGFALLEVMFALAISAFVALAMVTMVANQNKALTHFKIRSEMLNMLEVATIVGDPCKSVRVSGGIPPLSACGLPNTPSSIEILYADGARVDQSSGYLLQGACDAGFYALKIKSSLVTKVDPLTSQKLGEDFFEPAHLRFAGKAWLAGGCP